MSYVFCLYMDALGLAGGQVGSPGASGTSKNKEKPEGTYVFVKIIFFHTKAPKITPKAPKVNPKAPKMSPNDLPRPPK